MEWVVGIVVGLLFGAIGTIIFLKITANKSLLYARQEAERLLEDARKEAENLKREKVLEVQEELFEQKHQLEREMERKRAELHKLEHRLDQRELDVDRRIEQVDKRERDLRKLQHELQEKERYIKVKTKELNELIAEQIHKLEEISGLSREEAKALLLKDLEEEAREEGERIALNILEKTRLEAKRKAREIVVQAIQQVAAQQSVESTVSVVTLPNDDMKGRIIGREGRNIRSFEMVTGVDVIIDDTPEIVVLSSFNSYRREIARQAMEKLIADGRIHPARIEEVVEKTEQEMKESLREIGEQALLEVGVHGVPPELVELLGKLKYRTSYGQNVLNHCIEVAYLCGIMAAELDLEVHLAKRAGLFHDIGKALDSYTEADHAQVGADLLRKFNEHEVVVNAAEAHHDEKMVTSVYTLLVAAADQISASRPGARRETLENFIQRMEQLEGIATRFEGVDRAYAIQAGREVRVFVETETVDDNRARALAREIAKKIQEEMEFPWEIRVSVIREYRAYDYAT